MPMALLNLDKVLKVHKAALAYTVAIQRVASANADTETTHRVTRAALSSLMHDIACLHQAILPLCATGWACAAPVLLRTMLEGAMSVAVIVNSNRPDVTAFKYFYAKVPDDDMDPAMKPAVEQETQANVGRHLPQMTDEDQTAAKTFLEAPAAGYFWYSDMFRGPTAIIRKYLHADMLKLYRDLSTAAHLGFQGLRIFRDEPDKLDINPRTDPRSQGFAMISSSRILAEATHVREHFEGLDTGGYALVVAKIAECAGG
jgi:hypothetical protein